ncbi:ammonium transporter [Desulfoscipio geothermicus]|uniref:Ammonium transporter n=1 Tax=Desulfoscipio geothermicus DSM 3669 TaxID=1121426 RepID=A0A1I6CPP8_9FIRM|nr:ammonium transporter [Desulfoscipio geothermicus]SFQ95122.1 ammonium transporter (TC 1.A.11) [Desulfoscipio geothermicus DSM 3669]
MKKRLGVIASLALIMIFIFPVFAFAAEEGIDTGDTAWIIVSTALVFLMVPGLALFYGGMVRQKNVLNTMMMSFICLGVITIQWVLWGYSLSFGPDINKIIGDLSYFGLSGVGMEPNGTIPHLLFMVFQMMFAILTPALITGAMVERMRFPAYMLFLVLWATLVYDPICHWVWGGGWLGELGALDFAGGTVVHISSGISALVAALVLGKRKGYGTEPMVPHNVPYVVLGAAMLWFGWFGFNAGSELAADGVAAAVFVNTQIATGAAVISWVLAEWLRHGKPTMLGAASGAIAGLVAITPACAFVTPMGSLVIGLVAGALCYFAVSTLKVKLGYDDSLDVFGIHGIGGIWGALATGLLSVEAGSEGLFYGNPAQFGIQAVGVGATIVLASVATFVILKVVGAITALRVNGEAEAMGLDVIEHSEKAYSV